jgi:hypothetical protein
VRCCAEGAGRHVVMCEAHNCGTHFYLPWPRKLLVYFTLLHLPHGYVSPITED